MIEEIGLAAEPCEIGDQAWQGRDAIPLPFEFLPKLKDEFVTRLKSGSTIQVLFEVSHRAMDVNPAP